MRKYPNLDIELRQRCLIVAVSRLFILVSGGPGRSPTCDLRVRSALLYATELPGHVLVVYRVGCWCCGGKLGGGEFMPEIQRRSAVTVNIGGIRGGSDSPVVVQSMTNTETA